MTTVSVGSHEASSGVRRLLWLCVLGLGYVAWVHPLIGRPLMADEALVAVNAARPTHEARWALGHPPFYPELLRLGHHVFGWTFHEFHWLGVLCVLIQLPLIYAIAERLRPGAGRLAALLWITHPMVIQGSVILENDNTLLSVWITAWILAWLETPWPPSAKDCAWLGILFFMGVWTKLSTPLALPVAVLAFSIARRDLKTGLRVTGWIAAWGVGLFVVAAWLYIRLYDFSFAFVAWHNLTSIDQNLLGAEAPFSRDLINRAVRVALWCNPLLLLLTLLTGGAVLTRRVRFAAPRSSLLWWFVLLIGIGYVAVRGLHFGFAKYHFPLLPTLLALVSAGCVDLGFPTTRRHWRWLAIGSLVVAAVWWLVVGDVLYAVNYELRIALISEHAQALRVLRSLALRLGGMALVLLLVVVMCQRAARGRAPRVIVTVACLLTFLLGANIAQNAYQRTTAYSTTYCYGRSIPDMQALIAWLRRDHERFPDQVWMAPVDALRYAEMRLYPAYWSEPAPLLKGLQDPRTRGLIISPTVNTVTFYRDVLSREEIRRLLERDFVRQQLGEYTIWSRHGIR